MDIWFSLLLLVHLLALLAAGATAVVMPIIGARMAAATPEGRTNLMVISDRLSLNTRIALGALLISGPLMLWLRYGGVDGANVWFWIKMALVAVMLVAVIISSVNGKRVLAGDRQAAALQRRVGMVNRFAFLGVIIAAVLAFN
jgi:uncharacterized membrane protein